jgi:hypothetical protein
MNQISGLGISVLRPTLRDEPRNEYVLTQRPLARVLAFRNRDINDLVNSQFVKNEILGYWKVYRQIQRRSEVIELEGQWNHLGQRG